MNSRKYVNVYNDYHQNYFYELHVIFLSIRHLINERYRRQTTSLNMHLQFADKMYQLSDHISGVHLFKTIITFDIHNIIIGLGQSSSILSKANPDKCYVLVSEKSDTQVIVENDCETFRN